MNIVKCTNGHFFDSDSYPVCPHCGAAVAPSAPAPEPPQPQKKGFFGKKFGKKHATPSQTPPPPPPGSMPVPQSYAVPFTTPSGSPAQGYPAQAAPQVAPQVAPQTAPQPMPQAPVNGYANQVSSANGAMPMGKVRNVGGHTVDFWDANSSETSIQGDLQIKPEQVAPEMPVTPPPAPVQQPNVTVSAAMAEMVEIPVAQPAATIAPMNPVPSMEPKMEVNEPQVDNSLAEAVKQASANSTGKTLSYFSAITGDDADDNTGSSKPVVVDPVVGWIICVHGSHLGESFSIYAGANSIGRDRTNRIVLPREASVSRSKHAIITYEPKHRKFYIKPGESSGLTYINEEYITESRMISAKDVIELGDSKFLLIPLCGDDFTWEEYIKGRD